MYLCLRINLLFYTPCMHKDIHRVYIYICIHIVDVRTRYAYVYIHLCIIGCVYNIYSHTCTIITYIIYCKCTRLETHIY